MAVVSFFIFPLFSAVKYFTEVSVKADSTTSESSCPYELFSIELFWYWCVCRCTVKTPGI